MSDLKCIHVYCDASFDQKTGQGVAGYLITYDGQRSQSEMKNSVHLKQMSCSSSSKLELKAILWALDSLASHHDKIVVHTDLKSAVTLRERRLRIEERAFRSKSTGRVLSNADQYRRLFDYFDQIDIELHWVAGHKPTGERDNHESIISLVDQATRDKMRQLRLNASGSYT